MFSKVALSFISLFFISSLTYANSSTDWEYVCTALGSIDQCENVSVCEAVVSSSCKAKPHLVNTDWVDLCPKAGVSELACSWQFNCEWRESRFCLPYN